ncbi:hypothetical protein DN745_18105 [Bradymonas sediminis]|uniref:LicD/FKTN/FKRP nucleotidyltransferase domain-containing protein n=2 Tax=Bradymonas sediminis TaxID=1548548 RepID=A0A2Z4FQU3_9DELT|nr:hypothetical protein DN745_18105 [Bradymonas sediminis]
MNMAQCKENLFVLADILDAQSIRYGIIYGTLLGAIRDNGFIPWDEDVDLFVLDEDRQLFLSLLFEMRQEDLEVVRYTGDLLSLMRGSDYIDIYFMRRKLFGDRVCGADRLRARFFETRETIQFLGRSFPTVAEPEAFLDYAYGKDWKTPIKHKHAEVVPVYNRCKSLIRVAQIKATERLKNVAKTFIGR